MTRARLVTIAAFFVNAAVAGLQVKLGSWGVALFDVLVAQFLLVQYYELGRDF